MRKEKDALAGGVSMNPGLMVQAVFGLGQSCSRRDVMWVPRPGSVWSGSLSWSRAVVTHPGVQEDCVGAY